MMSEGCPHLPGSHFLSSELIIIYDIMSFFPITFNRTANVYIPRNQINQSNSPLPHTAPHDHMAPPGVVLQHLELPHPHLLSVLRGVTYTNRPQPRHEVEARLREDGQAPARVARFVRTQGSSAEVADEPGEEDGHVPLTMGRDGRREQPLVGEESEGVRQRRHSEVAKPRRVVLDGHRSALYR